ncbi:MAG: glycosyltransferase family 9 protein [Flavobacteriales bacterium]|nr:glycosyltransferase family 9 protein [Flavobacteriales bacterium]
METLAQTQLNSILVIQTAFIGDAILGTALLERLHQDYPDAKIDYLVRNGNQSLFDGHPFLNEVLVWNKQDSKYAELWQMLREVRSRKYDTVFNIQRYAASGILTAFSGAKQTFGYENNPLSILFSKSVEHRFGKGFENVHEVDRVLDLIGCNATRTNPKLYPSEKDIVLVKEFQSEPYITIAPASVWFTKQLPVEKWIELIDQIPNETKVYLIGAKSDSSISKEIIQETKREVVDLTGKLKLLETAALMRAATMNYANDSAPVHLASAANAPMCEVFCSTVPEFGFTPLSENSSFIQTKEKLDCRPCGIHGKSACPKGHFKCAHSIVVSELVSKL